MPSKHSNAYALELSDRLTPPEMGRGIFVANRNARRLLDDGILLYEQGRHPTATALAVFAMEEAGKWWTLVQSTILRDEKKIRETWRTSRIHKPKLERAITVLMGANAASGGPSFSEADMRLLARTTQTTKLRCMYTAFVVGRRWTEPSSVCGPEECRNHLSVALIATCSRLRVTGQSLGAIFKDIPGFLGDKQEEAAKQVMIAWSQSKEAADLAAEDDAENEAFRTEARRRLNFGQ